MSTYLYLQCLSHDPIITNSGESGQHTYDLPNLRADIANRQHVVQHYNDWDGYGTFGGHWFRTNTARFLAQHVDCELGIIDEYGQRYALDGHSEKPIPELTIEQFVLDRLNELEISLNNESMHAPVRQGCLVLIASWRTIIYAQKDWPVMVKARPVIEQIDPSDNIRESMNKFAMQLTQQVDWMTRMQYSERFGNEAPTSEFIKDLANNWCLHPMYKEEWKK